MTEPEMEFQLLVKELEHADRQIGSYLDLQMKILGFVFTFLVGCLGFLVAGKAEGLENLPRLLVIASAVGSFGVLQSSINYGIALGYIYNKERWLSPRLQRLLKLTERPLYAVRAFQTSPARLPVFLSTFVVALGVDVLNAVLLFEALSSRGIGTTTRFLAIAATALLAVVVVVQALMGLAMARAGVVASELAGD